MKSNTTVEAEKRMKSVDMMVLHVGGLRVIVCQLCAASCQARRCAPSFRWHIADGVPSGGSAGRHHGWRRGKKAWRRCCYVCKFSFGVSCNPSERESQRCICRRPMMLAVAAAGASWHAHRVAAALRPARLSEAPRDVIFQRARNIINSSRCSGNGC